ncbi:MAG: hypothetical protein WC712_01985 [Candidatus Brocadiia bacterium]
MTPDLSGIFSSQPGWLSRPDLEDVAIASRVSLARNLSGFVFADRAGDFSLKHVEELLRASLDAIPDSPFCIWSRADDIPLLLRGALSERLIGGPELFAGKRRWSLAMSGDERFSAFINASDHLLVSVTSPGFQTEEVWHEIGQLDDSLGTSVEFAFDEEFGFLTSSAREVGTGLKACAILHLPALSVTNEIERALRATKEIGYTLDGAFGAERAVGHIYRIINDRTLGMSEADIITGIGKAVAALESYERKARESLSHPERRTRAEDRIMRAVGSLERARLLPLVECMDSLSLLRLGATLELLPKKAGALLFSHIFGIQNAHIQLSAGREMDEAERDMIRAEAMKKALSKALSTRTGRKEA